MVNVYFDGQSGNNLFQYFLGRCIAKEKGYSLTFKYTNNQPNSVKKENDFFIFNGLKLPTHIEGVVNEKDDLLFKSHIFDWGECLKHDGSITLKGYFQNYEFYKEYKKFILKEIFKYNNINNIEQEDDSITLHLRLESYPWITPISFYINILKEKEYKVIYVVTDSPNHKHIKKLKSMFNIKVISNTPKDDFNFLCNSKNLIISQSTFAWWASFLSKAKNIYFPVINDYNSNGIWYNQPKRNIDLFVNDEERYKRIII